MSQYPFPYNTPDPNYYGQPWPYPDPNRLAPFRRAGGLLLGIGLLLLLPSMCCALVGIVITPDELARQMETQASHAGAALPQFDPAMVRKALIVFGFVLSGMGLAYVALGVIVMSGSKGAAITAAVLNVVGIVGCLLVLLVALVLAVSGAAFDPLGAGLCIVVIALLVWSLIWIAQALTRLKSAQMPPPPYWQFPPPPGSGGYNPPPPPPAPPSA